MSMNKCNFAFQYVSAICVASKNSILEGILR